MPVIPSSMTIKPMAQNAFHQHLLLFNRRNDIKPTYPIGSGSTGYIVQIKVGDCGIYHITTSIHNGIVHQSYGYR